MNNSIKKTVALSLIFLIAIFLFSWQNWQEICQKDGFNFDFIDIMSIFAFRFELCPLEYR